MKGLLKNNFYAALSNAKVFAVILFVLGIFAAVLGKRDTSWMIGYMLLSMIGFSFNSIASVRKESVGKWSKYKLTTPVTRSAIVRSYYLSLLSWLAVGMAFAGMGAALSVALRGFPFDRTTDIFLLFVAGVGISLFMGAIFFPLFYIGGEERNEVSLVISLLGGVWLVMGLTALVNAPFPAPHDPDADPFRRRDDYWVRTGCVWDLLSRGHLYLSQERVLRGAIDPSFFASFPSFSSFVEICLKV